MLISDAYRNQILTEMESIISINLVNSYSFRSIRTEMSTSTGTAHLKIIFGQFVLILVNSYSFKYEYESTKMGTN